MSDLDNKSLKNVTIKFTTTLQYSTSKNVSLDSYFTSPLMHNVTILDNFSNTKYKVYVP